MLVRSAQNGKTVTGHLLGYSASKGKFRKERSPLLHFDEKWLADNKDKVEGLGFSFS